MIDIKWSLVIITAYTLNRSESRKDVQRRHNWFNISIRAIIPHEFPLLGVGRWCECAAWRRRYRHEAEMLLPIVHTDAGLDNPVAGILCYRTTDPTVGRAIEAEQYAITRIACQPSTNWCASHPRRRLGSRSRQRWGASTTHSRCATTTKMRHSSVVSASR